MAGGVSPMTKKPRRRHKKKTELIFQRNILEVENYHDTVEKCAQKIRTKTIKPYAQVFARNVEDLIMLCGLPVILLYTGVFETRHTAFIPGAILKIKKNLGKGKPLTKSEHRRIHQEADRQLRKYSESAAGKEAIKKEVEFKIEHILNMSDMRQAVINLLRAITVTSWTIFEALSKDIWIAALNSNCDILAKRAMKILKESSPSGDITSKTISTDLLAKHGFDVRNCMGTLLSGKFDFTGVTGIKKAYVYAFDNKKMFERIFDVKGLSHLEASRHVIVHNAGIIDENYLRRTKRRLKVGKALPLNSRIVSRHVKKAIDSGCQLLKAVDKCMPR